MMNFELLPMCVTAEAALRHQSIDGSPPSTCPFARTRLLRHTGEGDDNLAVARRETVRFARGTGRGGCRYAVPGRPLTPSHPPTQIFCVHYFKTARRRRVWARGGASEALRDSVGDAPPPACVCER